MDSKALISGRLSVPTNEQTKTKNTKDSWLDDS